MIRGISLRGAIGLNVITMIGIGPLITIPLVLQKLAGPLALAGWILGAAVALCDGLVWAELGSQYPRAGGTYAYLREIFGERGPGRLLAFLFNWQYFLSASLIISSGYIGFAQYAAYLYAPLASNWWFTHAAAFGIGALTIALVYRRVSAVSATGAALAVCAIATVIVVGIAGFWHGHLSQAFAGAGLSAHGSLTLGFLAALGGALYITLYDYTGYAQIALAGEELQRPHRTLPFSIVASVLIVLTIYLFLQVGVLSAIPWQTLFDAHGQPTPQSQFVGSTVVAHAWGPAAAAAVTVLILVTAFASLYGNLAGAARVPFAAARDNAFLPVFSKLHPRERFPHVALLGIGVISLVGSLFTLDAVIAALTAAAVLGGSIPQIAALFVLRARGIRAPFRMWLYPLPALVALFGWAFAFCSTGTVPMLLGAGWLAAGAAVFMIVQRRARAWPFAAGALLLAFAYGAAPAQAAQKPAFAYGAAFFYERIPRSQWRRSLHAYHALGINTIDLYVMWNWHELSDGNFDFTGRTNPRRDLRGLLKLIHSEGFALILRPGPVIRNEWRNGGYPAWLLKRPEYDMPLRDILEGRYPATATLQNAHSDAAAAEWMANATHMRYAERWLRHVYAQAAPFRSGILAIALDDDQGAYIDNDTWPGPHFHAYMHRLQAVAGRALPGIPAFINTYQMKVTASAPAWAWGNWYQSDTYSIGEHDRAQIEFSTALLQTQAPPRPIMVSEFQAGWLQGADEAEPRAADPSNTTLALHTFLQMGAHGVVNFPVQDTFNPSGWEAPWANASYAWDAAYSAGLRPSARWGPTAHFGALIEQYGESLAHTHPAVDAAIAYAASAYDASQLTNNDIAAIAAATVSAQERCRAVHLTCALVDLRYGAARLSQYRVIVVPGAGIKGAFVPAVQHALSAFRSSGGVVVATPDGVHVAHPAAGGIPDAALLAGDNGRYAFLDIVNYDARPRKTQAAMVRAGRFSAFVPALTVRARDALLIPLGVIARKAPLHPHFNEPPVEQPLAFTDDGYPHRIFRNDSALLVVSACAGARALLFRSAGAPIFSGTGGLRDAWTPELPPSPRDYIAKYTHPIAAGTFNRCYALSKADASHATYRYTAPDAPGGPAGFAKTIAFAQGGFELTETAHFASPQERALHITSLLVRSDTQMVEKPGGYALFSPTARRVIMVRWSGAAASKMERHEHDALLTLTYASGAALRVWYAGARAEDLAGAQARYAAFAKRAEP